MRLLTTLLASLLLAAPALAQTPGDCDLGTAAANLNDSDVRARLFNTGSLFFGSGGKAQYVVPQDFGTSPIFAAGLWVGGQVDGELRTAAARYANFEFWPGPLNKDATLPDADDCSAFDRIFVVSRADIEAYDATGAATDDLRDWPVNLGAPVVDGDGEVGNYDLAGGDRPLVYGTQAAFWVMNDVGNDHGETETEPIGLEVRVTAFTIASAEAALHQGTFYRYELVNRNSAPLTEAYLGLFLDPDLGAASDDYTGVDTTRGLAYTYNADDRDEVYGDPPAVGYDFLSGAGSHTYFFNGSPSIVDPGIGEEYYNVLQGFWADGVPMTEGGLGSQANGEETVWGFPGDPESEQFWSEVNADGTGADNPPGDRRQVISTEAFTIPPGGSHTVDFAILFALGESNLNSVTRLKAVSDEVQALYDAGELFAPFPVPPPPPPIEAPLLVSPAPEARFEDEPVPLAWTGVGEAYELQIDTNPSFSSPQRELVAATSRTVAVGVQDTTVTFFWRVRVRDGLATSPFSETRTFSVFLMLQIPPANFAQGNAIVETAYPGAEVCPSGSDDLGCRFFSGNTVWLSPNSTGDYVLTNSTNEVALLSDPEAVGGDDFEMRFTDACAGDGACLGVYADAAPGSGADEIASVPFELWNVGTEDDAGDDTRMIPVLRSLADTEPTDTWTDAFPATQEVIVDGETFTLPVTQRVLGMMPDRDDGYLRFADAARDFGGPGAAYNPDKDGDLQIDSTSFNGQTTPCRSQGYYVDFCYRDASNRFVAPIGSLTGIVLVDLAGDGTTPPAGTVIRFSTPEQPVSTEDDAPTQPPAFALGAAYPNPVRSAATVPFEVGRAGRVRLAVYDVLGREVAVLAEGSLSAGEHQARLDGSRLASGVYVVVLEAEGQRQTTKALVLR